MPMTKLPPDAATLEAANLRALLIVATRPHPSQTYILYDLERQQPIGWHSVRREGRQIILEPASLVPGDYLLIVPTEDLLGGHTYHYFRLY